MISDATAQKLERAVQDCDEARAAVERLLNSATGTSENDEETLTRLANALVRWRKAQRRFMEEIGAADDLDVATAALLLKTNRGVEPANARRGIPGLPVEGTDQPFDLDTTGKRGQALMRAVTEHASAD